MTTRRTVGLFGLGTLAASVLFAGPSETPAVTCVPADGHARVEASAPADAAAMRFYFREAAATEEYFVEMIPARDGRFWAVVPKVAPDARSIAYRFVSVSSSGAEATLASGAADVSASCAAARLSEVENAFASNLVLGRSSEGTPLNGFSCEGIVAEISPSGQLQAARSCEPSIEASSETQPNATAQASRGSIQRSAVSRGGDRRVLSRSRP